MCYIQFVNQKEKLALDSWILNEIVSSLHYIPRKKFHLVINSAWE